MSLIKNKCVNAATLLSMCLLGALTPLDAAGQLPPQGHVFGVADATGQQVTPEQFALLYEDMPSCELAAPLSYKKRSLAMPAEITLKSARKATVASDLEISGSLVSSRAWRVNDSTYTPAYGIYSYTPGTNTTGVVHQDDNLFVNAGGFKAWNHYYFVNYVTQYNMPWATFYGYSISDNWSQVIKAQAYNSGILAYDATYDYTTSTIWGCYLSDDFKSCQLGWESNQSATTKHVVCTLDAPYYALACNYDGKLYGIDAKGDLYQIDKATGAQTLVSNTGVDVADYLQSATFDRRSGKLYWAAMTTSGGALYEVDPATAETGLVHIFPNNEEFTGIYVSSPEAQDEAPAAVQDITLGFTEANLGGTVTFTVPTLTFGGGTLTGNLTYHVVANGDTVATGTAAAGTNVTVAATVKASGLNTFIVTVSNDAGSSPVSSVQQWIGADKPQSVSQVTAVFDADSAVNITWTASTAGENSHYFVKDSVRYNIYRLPDHAVIARGITGLSVTDSTLNSSIPGVYLYTVEPQCFTTVGDTTGSNEIVMGGVYTIPFLDNFATTANEGYLQLLKVDANGDGIGWPSKINSRLKYAQLTTTVIGTRPDGATGYNPVATDEWMLTPLLKLDKGTVYSFSLMARGTNSNVPLLYDVAYGSGDDYNGYTVVATDSAQNHNDDDTFEKTTMYTTRAYTFTVPEGGTYRVGFHVKRTPPELTSDNMSQVITDYSSTMYFRGVNVEVVAKSTAPDSVYAFKATAGDKGIQQVTLDITAPTLTADNTRLDSLTGIRVYRNDTLIADITPALPGHDYQYIDQSAPMKKSSTYKATGYNADGEGPGKTATVFVGEDMPSTVRNLRIRDTGEGFRLSWDLPDGQNGGYIDPANMYYTVVGRNDTGTAYVVKDSITSMSFTVDSVVVGDQKAVIFAVGCYNQYGGNLTSTTMTVAGDPYTLPFKESFTESHSSQYELATDGTSPWWGWVHNMVYSSANSINVTNNKYDYDGTCGMAIISYAPKGAQASFNSPRVSLSGAKQAKLSFYYKAYPGLDIPIKVVINDADQKLDTVLFIDQSQEAESSGCWRRATADLTPYVNSKWIMVYFWFDVKKYTVNITQLDDIEINANMDNDLKVDITGATGADGGSEAKIDLKITNMGNKPANAFTVRLFADNELVGSKEVTAALPADSIVSVGFSYLAESRNSQQVAIEGQVEYAADENTDNNICTLLMPVESTKLDRVEDLAGQFDEERHVQLTWTAPQNVHKVIKESFEDYTPFGSCINEGNWWAFDRMMAYDSNPTVYVFDEKDPLYVKGSGSGMFRVWNPGQLGYDDDVETSRNYSIDGQQFLICSNNGDEYATDSWLVSPELDGAGQTVSFWAQTAPLGTNNDDEVIEVLYAMQDPHCDTVAGSIADTLNINAFTLAKRIMVPTTWTKYYVSLPEGVKHFAIRIISDGWFLKFDNVLYRNGAIEPTGYNVYRDGELIGTVGATPGYTDMDSDSGGFYTVTALYGDQESDRSNEVQVTQTGVSDIKPDLCRAGDIYNVVGQLVRKNASSAAGLGRGFYIMNGKKILVK